MTILQEILEHKKQEVAYRQKLVPVSMLKDQKHFSRQTVSARQAFSGRPGVIAEFKRKSPSKGYFNQSADAASVCKSYADAGAFAVSVLTDQTYFGGSLKDLEAVREQIDITVLRKDFIVSEYQIYESKAAGADLILLIASALLPEEARSYALLAKELGLEVLLEVHSREEIESHLFNEVDLLGVNNRNLKTFETDIALSKELIKEIPDQFVAVSESGISDPAAAYELAVLGYKAFLIGESFMKQPEPGKACGDFIRDLKWT